MASGRHVEAYYSADFFGLTKNKKIVCASGYVSEKRTRLFDTVSLFFSLDFIALMASWKNAHHE